jgi:hypothetical protein
VWGKLLRTKSAAAWHQLLTGHRRGEACQVECINRTLTDATVKKYHYQTHHHLKEHLQAFLMAYNFAK